MIEERVDYTVNKKRIILIDTKSEEVIGETSYFPVMSKNPYDIVDLANDELVNMILYRNPEFSINKVAVRALYGDNLNGGRAYISSDTHQNNFSKCYMLSGAVVGKDDRCYGVTSLFLEDTTRKFSGEIEVKDLEMRIVANDGYMLTIQHMDSAMYIGDGGLLEFVPFADGVAFESLEELVDFFGGLEALNDANMEYIFEEGHLDHYLIVHRKDGIINFNPQAKDVRLMNFAFGEIVHYYVEQKERYD